MSNNNKHYFHFTLGPVQGFVSQARRTRDFWAGSFILSWLSAVAIQAVRHQEGKDAIKFPRPDEDYMQWLTDNAGKDDAKRPTQGSIPNRFKGLVAEVDPDKFDPDAVTRAVKSAWVALADKVWENDLGHLSPSSDAAIIWERQIENFWDMSWVITPDEKDTSALDKRKNWRSYTLTSEPGVKCSMMDGWQELSGVKRPNRKELNKFWDEIREQSATLKNDLKETETLCAIAFVKRRFSRVFKSLEHEMPQGWRLKGWKVPSGVPSVSYMAAVHWIEKVLQSDNKSLLDNFTAEANTLTGQYGEWDTDIHCLKKADTENCKKFRSLDGNVFFESQLENKNIFDDTKQASNVATLLRTINKDIKPASPFYAILMMDGDSLGVHMSGGEKKQKIITEGLNTFTQAVSTIVKENNGFLIYAGGDDVLAVLPLEDAFPCAIALRKKYNSCFDKKIVPTTLSGAIEFAHIKIPLGKVLKDSHQLLDDIAKDQSGRDSIAVRVWKPGGKTLEWAQPWDVALNEEKSKTDLEEIAESFQQKDKDDQFTNNFFYKIRERFSLLNPSQGGEKILGDKEAIDLMTMEYLNSSTNRDKSIKEVKPDIEKLLKQCRPHIRVVDRTDKIEVKPTEQLKIDAALLVRFLVQKGAE